MAKGKLSTPAWIIEGYDSEADYNKAKGISTGHPKGVHLGGARTPKRGENLFKASSRPRKSKILLGAKKGKTFKIRECAKCGSDDVAVVIGDVGMWKCKKCGWKGVDVVEKELTEDEFMKYLDEKGEEVA